MTFPARGTWIEMGKPGADIPQTPDVPRKGNVDRNIYGANISPLSSSDVPRKGNVDRNPMSMQQAANVIGRSPQGERG